MADLNDFELGLLRRPELRPRGHDPARRRPAGDRRVDRRGRHPRARQHRRGTDEGSSPARRSAMLGLGARPARRLPLRRDPRNHRGADHRRRGRPPHRPPEQEVPRRARRGSRSRGRSACCTGSGPTASSGTTTTEPVDERRPARRTDAPSDAGGVRGTATPRGSRSRAVEAARDGQPAVADRLGAGRDGQDHARVPACRCDRRRAGPAVGDVVRRGGRAQGHAGGAWRPVQDVLFVDEVHRWSKAQQDVLLPAVEDGTITLIGATTENPYFSLNTPLLSRCLLLRLEPLSAEDVRAILQSALGDEDRGLGKLGLSVDDDAVEHLITISGGDARMALTGLEAAALAATAAGEARVTLDLAADAVQRKAVVYDRQGDAHYDVVSAFIKIDPRLRPRRRAVLAGADDRGRRGPALHRPAADRARERGRGAGRPDGAAAGRRGRARRRARRAARGAAEPRAGHALPRSRAEIEQRVHGALGGDRGCRDAPTRCPRTCAIPSYPALGSSATARAIAIRTTRRITTSISSTDRNRSKGGVTTSPRAWGRRAGTGARDAAPLPNRVTGKLAAPDSTTGGDTPMTVLAMTPGDVALIVLAAAWVVLVGFLAIVLLNTYNVLTSTKLTIDAMREETVPLLREVKTSVEKANRETRPCGRHARQRHQHRGARREADGVDRGGRGEPAREDHQRGRGPSEGVREGQEGPGTQGPAVACAGSSGSRSGWARVRRPRSSRRAG